MSQLAIVTPTHKAKISDLERKRLEITLKFNNSFQHFFIVPESMSINYLIKLFPNSRFVRFNDNYFISKLNYNSLMLDPKTYEKFLDFKFLLLSELDSFVIKNLRGAINSDFTYIGSAWNPSIYVCEFAGKIYPKKSIIPNCLAKELPSGNGGLSLRKTKVLYEILNKALSSDYFYKILKSERRMNEDVLTVFMLMKFGIQPNPKAIANRFFIETTPQGSYSLEEIYGFHALKRYDPNLENKLIKSLL